MIKMKNILLESPDSIFVDNNNYIYFNVPLTVPFGYINNKLLLAIESKSGLIKTHENISGDNDIYDSDGNRYRRQQFKFAGRFWAYEKLISFWGKYPNRNELNKIIKDIKKEFRDIENNKSTNKNIYWDVFWKIYDSIKDLDIYSTTWRIDVQDNIYKPTNLIPLVEYQNTSHKFKDVEHVKPPSAKVPKEFKGYGSHKTYAGLTPTQYHQMISTSENKE